jgi:two-component system copper resistance phosphate regulon response regulator CusR
MSKKILIVDDVREIAEAFKKQLDFLQEYETDIVSSGQEALNALENSSYDLVLLDLVMPELDGLEVLRTIQNNPGKYHFTRVMVLSNISSEETQKEALALGAKDFIIKTDADIENILQKFFQ